MSVTSNCHRTSFLYIGDIHSHLTPFLSFSDKSDVSDSSFIVWRRSGTVELGFDVSDSIGAFELIIASVGALCLTSLAPASKSTLLTLQPFCHCSKPLDINRECAQFDNNAYTSYSPTHSNLPGHIVLLCESYYHTSNKTYHSRPHVHLMAFC